MSTDDTADGQEAGGDPVQESSGADVRDRLERGTDRAVEEFDDGVVDLLSWLLDTETRARIFVALRRRPDSTSDEVAEGTGLYPSTVREALAELHEEGLVVRGKRESDGAGNNPYEYAAIAPSELVGNAVEDVQTQLNAVCNLDRYIDDGGTSEDSESKPVTITVEEGTDA